MLTHTQSHTQRTWQGQLQRFDTFHVTRLLTPYVFTHSMLCVYGMPFVSIMPTYYNTQLFMPHS